MEEERKPFLLEICDIRDRIREELRIVESFIEIAGERLDEEKTRSAKPSIGGGKIL